MSGEKGNVVLTRKLSNNIEVIEAGHTYRLAVEGLKDLPDIQFQAGPVKEVGTNGWQNEELIRILINRISFLDAIMHSDENLEAIDHLHDALDALEKRTRKRIAAGVEGTNDPLPAHEEQKPYDSGNSGERPAKPTYKPETD